MDLFVAVLFPRCQDFLFFYCLSALKQKQIEQANQYDVHVQMLQIKSLDLLAKLILFGFFFFHFSMTKFFQLCVTQPVQESWPHNGSTSPIHVFQRENENRRCAYITCKTEIWQFHVVVVQW